MKNKALTNELVVSLRNIVDKTDLLYEDILPEINVYTNKNKTTTGRTRLTIVLGLHDMAGNSDRKRYGLSLPPELSVKETKQQVKLIESKLNEALKLKLESYDHHDFLDALDEYVQNKRGKMRDTTVDGYEFRAKKVHQYFDEFNYSVEKISPKIIAGFINWMESSGNGDKGLSYRSIKDTHGLLSGFFKDMVNKEVIVTNPCEHTELPHDRKPNVEADTVRWLTIEDYNKLMAWLEKYKDSSFCPYGKLYEMIKLTIYSGLRKEEILALQWDAVDFETGHFEIRRTRTKGKKIYDLDDVKSPASHRSYPMPPEIMKLFMGLKEKSMKDCNNSKYVFSWSDKDLLRWESREPGEPYSPDYISNIFRKMVINYEKETGVNLTGLSFHKLRHSCCSILYDKGWTLDEVQQWLGHEDSEVTRRIYLHKQEEWKDKKAQTLDFLWKKHNG